MRGRLPQGRQRRNSAFPWPLLPFVVGGAQHPSSRLLRARFRIRSTPPTIRSRQSPTGWSVPSTCGFGRFPSRASIRIVRSVASTHRLSPVASKAFPWARRHPESLDPVVIPYAVETPQQTGYASRSSYLVPCLP